MMRLNRTDRAPVGHWTFILKTPQRRRLQVGPVATLDKLVRDVQKVASLNKVIPLPTREDIEHQICARNKGLNCTPNVAAKPKEKPLTVKPVAAKQAKRAIKPADYGSNLWGAMHMQGAFFQKEIFLTLVEYSHKAVSNAKIGCPKCASHFHRWRTRYPETKVANAEQAAVWTWAAHNNATRNRGTGEEMSFNDAAWLYGWTPVENPDAILAGLEADKKRVALSAHRQEGESRRKEFGCGSPRCKARLAEYEKRKAAIEKLQAK